MSSNIERLNSQFLARLVSDNFQPIGWFNIDHGTTLRYGIDVVEAQTWCFAVYAWVSYADGGTVVRIGKSESALGRRLNDYQRHLSVALSDTLGPNNYHKGATQPWEAIGWREFTVPFGGGLIFAQRVDGNPTDMKLKQTLRAVELRLIRDYDPPLCGVAKAGKLRKKLWESENGQGTAIRKRGNV